MEKAISTINAMPSNKAEIKTFTDKVKAELLSGSTELLPAFKQLKIMEKLIKDLMNDIEIKTLFITEFRTRLQKNVEISGATISIVNKTAYDYDFCGDEVYNKMKSDLEILEESIKAREAMLKTGVNPDTGETYKKPDEKQTSYLKVLIK